MKKTFVILSALLMASSCVSLSASAFTQQCVVAAINDDHSLILKESSQASSFNVNYALAESVLEDFTGTQETFELGDIIELDNVKLPSIEPGETIYIQSLYAEDLTQPSSISKVGSIFDHPETDEFTVTFADSTRVCLQNSEEFGSIYLYDWTKYGSYQPNCVDVSTLQTGDVVTCITYNDIPMLITEKISDTPSTSKKPATATQITPDGDANEDGSLDILDVIAVNQAVLGKAILTEEQTAHIDFNQNGIADSSDSLTMLKMIVGLE